jgi:hypothetical protein
MAVRMKSVLATLFALAFVAGSAQAADFGFYFGGSVGQSTVEFRESLSNNFDYHFDEGDTGYKVLAGFNLLPFLGVEAAYVDFGTPSDSQNIVGVGGVDAKFDLTGWEAFVVGTLPIGPVDLFVKGGGISAQGDAKLAAVGGGYDHFSQNNEYFAYGVGGAFNFGKFAIRAEYEGYDVDIDHLYFISVGATYHL